MLKLEFPCRKASHTRLSGQPLTQHFGFCAQPDLFGTKYANALRVHRNQVSNPNNYFILITYSFMPAICECKRSKT